MAGTVAAYESPALLWPGETANEQPWLAWVVFVLAYSVALAWATYCVWQDGSPEISWSWFKFKVACYR